jgi:hypothetical protein
MSCRYRPPLFIRGRVFSARLEEAHASLCRDCGRHCLRRITAFAIRSRRPSITDACICNIIGLWCNVAIKYNWVWICECYCDLLQDDYVTRLQVAMRSLYTTRNSFHFLVPTHFEGSGTLKQWKILISEWKWSTSTSKGDDIQTLGHCHRHPIVEGYVPQSQKQVLPACSPLLDDDIHSFFQWVNVHPSIWVRKTR